jgi:hypothetical protein
MKTFSILSVLLTALLGLGLQGCMKDSCQIVNTYYKKTAVYKTLEEMRKDLTVEPARELKKPGKIYFYNDYVFINEQREGIHVIDNADPSNPKQVAFIGIPGNIDMAAQGGVLYADNYINLLAIDITNPANPVQLGRAEGVFPALSHNASTGRYLVYYDWVETTVIYDCPEDGKGESSWGNQHDGNISFDASLQSSIGSNTKGGAGVGGSMARFTLLNGHLYAVDKKDLRVFNLASPLQPEHVNTVNIGLGIETIFPHENRLFIGSENGMFIYDASAPGNPFKVSELAHARACDPVFVSGDYAYVTLRDGTVCQGFVNQLDLVDISDIANPRLEKVFPMQNPHGLSIRDNTLFLCEGKHGLKTFDISNPLELDKNLLAHVKNLDAYDVISVPGKNNVLMLIGKDGFYQYDAGNPNKLKLLSKIAVKS